MARVHYSRDVESPDSDAELQHILRRLSRGDTLIVPHVSHLANGVNELRDVLAYLADRGVIFRPRRTSLRPGELPEVAFKHDLRTAACARASARGAYGNSGRRVKGDRELTWKLRAAGIEPEQIAMVLGVSERIVRRYLKVEA